MNRSNAIKENSDELKNNKNNRNPHIKIKKVGTIYQWKLTQLDRKKIKDRC